MNWIKVGHRVFNLALVIHIDRGEDTYMLHFAGGQRDSVSREASPLFEAELRRLGVPIPDESELTKLSGKKAMAA